MIRSIPARGSGDKDRMRTMITWLGFRHVKYGVRPHYIPIMGQVHFSSLIVAACCRTTSPSWARCRPSAGPPCCAACAPGGPRIQLCRFVVGCARGVREKGAFKERPKNGAGKAALDERPGARLRP